MKVATRQALRLLPESGMPGLLLYLLYCLIHVLIPLNREAIHKLNAVLMVWILWGGVSAWRGIDRRRRILLFRWMGGLAIGTIAGYLVTLTRTDAVRPEKLVGSFLLAVGSILLHLRITVVSGERPSCTRPMLALPVLALLGYVSCFVSWLPANSLRYYVRELGLYVPAAQALFILLMTRWQVRHGLVPAAVAGAAAGAACLLAWCGMVAGPESWQAWMLEHHWIRASAAAEVSHLPWRVQFPFRNPNMLGNYALLALFATLALVPALQDRKTRTGFRLVAGLLLLVLVVSLTRSAYVAALAGLLTFLGWGRRRRDWRAWGVICFLVVLAFASPQARYQTRSLLDSRTYTEEDSNFVSRYLAWKAGWMMARENPLLGVGYGTETYEKLYELDYQARLGDVESKPHAHNNFLQYAAEMGFPAALLFVGWNLWILVGLWRRRLQGTALYAWLAATLVAIHVFGLVGYNLRLSVGVLTWVLMVVAAYAAFGQELAGCAPEKRTSEGRPSPGAQ